LKKDQKKEEKEDQITIEELIEKEVTYFIDWNKYQYIREIDNTRILDRVYGLVFLVKVYNLYCLLAQEHIKP
jgi:hypothetical protein